MALPINISELLNGKTVESERLEFKEGWNPERILKSICAFANDFNNWGGGYIILGVSEKDGLPVFPAKGLDSAQLNSIQRDLNNLCRRIIPNYFPVGEPIEVENKRIYVLWCPGGNSRPYKAPESLSEKSRYIYFIRRFSSTVHPTPDEELELLSMANQTPFDDQVNRFASISDFDLASIKIFLNKIGSDLERELPSLGMYEIARKMNIAEGADENLLPKNIGLLFFSSNTQKYFPSARIDIVTFEDEAGTRYLEKTFSGVISQQLTNALEYLRSHIVAEKVYKLREKAESERFYNYPYQALEEAVCNAVYHRAYNDDSPIEIRIYPTRIDIISFPGPLPPLTSERLSLKKFDVRKYRNRRIGDFLKELHLTEGRGTGIPTMLRESRKNGSPEPIFETDANRSFFKVSFQIHSKWYQVPDKNKSDTQLPANTKGTNQAKFPIYNTLEEIVDSLVQISLDSVNQVVNHGKQSYPSAQLVLLAKLIKFCENDRTRIEILKFLGKANNTRNYNSSVKILVQKKILKMSDPEKPRSPHQKYKTTEIGNQVLKIVKQLS